MLKKTPNYAAPLFFLLTSVLLWEFIVRLAQIPPWQLPSPLQIITAFREMLPLLLGHAKSTVIAALTGLLAAIVVALSLAMVMDFSKFIKQGLYPLIVISQTIPIISIAPLFIIWFGYGILPKVVVVALVCFFPVAVSIIEGMESADPDMVELLKTMGSSPWQTAKLVKFPAALPSFFAGLKIAGTYAVMGAVIGEWLGATSGLGVFMTRALHAYQLSRVFSAILLISAVSLVIFFFIELMSRIFMPWYYKERSED